LRCANDALLDTPYLVNPVTISQNFLFLNSIGKLESLVVPHKFNFCSRAFIGIVIALSSVQVHCEENELSAPGGQTMSCPFTDSLPNAEIKGTFGITETENDKRWAPFVGIELVAPDKTIVYRLALVRFRQEPQLVATQALYPGQEFSATEFLIRPLPDEPLHFSLRWDERGSIEAKIDSDPVRYFGVKRSDLRGYVRISGGTAKVSLEVPYKISCE
jgi:hypothetical protein